MKPSADDLAKLAWTFARRPHATGAEGAALLALLACNARGARPTRPDLFRWLTGSIGRTALYDALAALIAERVIAELPGRRLCLAALLPAETVETDETDAPHQSAATDDNGETAPPASAPTDNKSAAPDEKSATADVSHAREDAFKSFEKEKAAANAARARDEADLRRFAVEVCKLPAAAADQILATAKAQPVAEIAQALEQFHYAYTSGHGTGQSRLDACRNPVGQVIDWTRNPHKRDRLPEAALTLARWKQGQAARAEQQQREAEARRRMQADAQLVARFAQRDRHEQAALCLALREKAPTLAARFYAHFFDAGPGRDPLAFVPACERAAMLEALAAAEMLAENLGTNLLDASRVTQT